MSRLAALAILMMLVPAAAAEIDGLPGFVDAQAVVPGLRAEIRYAGPHNFTGAPVEGYDAPRCWLTREAAAALAGVQADLAPQGLGLLVYDCYRPVRAVRRFIAWAAAPDQERGKAEFYPDFAKRDLFRLGYIAEKSAHSRGSTVDLTLVEAATGTPLDMGTPFDFFGPASHPDFTDLPAAAIANRTRLADAMTKRGFVPFAMEWWHFTLANEPHPAAAFDVPIR